MRAGAIKVGLALAGIFLTGAVAGGFASVAWSKQNAERISAREWAERQLRRRTDELSLTPDQVERMRPIVQEFEEQLRGCRRKAMAEVSDVTRTMNARIEEELTSAQIKRFHEIVAKERERWEKEMQKRSQQRPDQRREGDRPPGPPREPGAMPAVPASATPPATAPVPSSP